MLKTITVFVNAFAILLTVSGLAQAQASATRKPGFELLMPTGTFTPKGAHDEDLKRANLTAVQLSYGLRPDLVLTSTVGWARTHATGLGADAKLDMFTYDIGAECRIPRRVGDGRFNVKPFTGLGVGARSYNYRDIDAATTHNLAAYAAAGGEIGLAKVRVRLEVRNYMTWLNPAGTDNVRRNDVAFMAGVRLGGR